MLTRQQHVALMAIKKCWDETGSSPSYREIMSAVGLRSLSGVVRLVNGLEERGFIRRRPRRAHAIEVLRLPHDGRAVLVGGTDADQLPSVERLAELSRGDASATRDEVAVLARAALASLLRPASTREVA